MKAYRNPFRNPMMVAAYHECICAYLRDSPALRRTSGNSIAGWFWRGYDNVPFNWDAESKKLMAYAQYRAGQYCSQLSRPKQ